jgi:glycolate oxidase FAD binding subunit
VNVSTRSIAGVLADIVGRERVVDDPARLAAAAVDGVTPRWLIRAAAVEQVAAVLALASEESLAVIPRGSGSALDLGWPPARVDVVLDLRGMDRVVEYNPDDLTASVEAGVTAGVFGARLAPHRQLLPVDPPGAASRTLGGLVATGAHGPLRARYGTLRDLLLGVRFVQADGVVTWGGARVVKSVTGYDVPKLMVGALGTLGVLCELTLRVHPRPEAEATRLARFDSLDAAGAFLARLLDSSVQPNRVEFLNGAALRRLMQEEFSRRLGGGRGVAAALAVSVGSVIEAVRAQSVEIDVFAHEAGGESAPLPDDFWDSYATVIAEAGRVMALHVSSLPSQLAVTVRSVKLVLGDLLPGEQAVIAGCAALGTLDVLLPASAIPVAVRLIERVRDSVANVGGHAMLRRAPREIRRAIDPWGPVDPGPLALMRALRDEFDPLRVLNPGRFVGGL